MRLLHTSDWHLGHKLHEHDRGAEHDAFLAWLLGALVDTEADALLVAGDIFDAANPPAEAQRRWYRFLAEARGRCPDLDIVVIGGNHDSGARLDAPRDLLDGIGVHVVGGVPRTPHGSIDHERLLVPIRDADGQVAAHVAAVPFLRVADLPQVEGADDNVVSGVQKIYDDTLELARERREPGQALLAMGHCYMTGTVLSELSERRILGGNQHALPVDLFPDDVAYVALGHLHKAQQVGAEHVRYSGSPIPLSMAERDYGHQVVLVDLKGGELAGLEKMHVPRMVDMVRIPADAPAPLDEVLAALAAHPDDPGLPWECWPYLEVRVRLERPEPSLRWQVDEALAGRPVRLAGILSSYTGTGEALGEAAPAANLRELEVEEVFRRCWAAKWREPPRDAVLQAFHEIVEAAHAGEDA